MPWVLACAPRHPAVGVGVPAGVANLEGVVPARRGRGGHPVRVCPAVGRAGPIDE